MSTFASLGVILKNGASKRATSSLRKYAPLAFSYPECYSCSGVTRGCPHAAAFGGIRVEVSLSIEPVTWHLRPCRSPLTAHVPKIFCICGFPREPSRETNDCNRGWAGNVRRFFGQPDHMMMVLRTVDSRHTGGMHSVEESSFES